MSDFGPEYDTFFRLPKWFYRGRHRGEYVEDPAWKHPRPPWRKGLTTDGEWITWNGTITFASAPPESGVATLVLTPPGDLGIPPAPLVTTKDFERLHVEQTAAYEDELRDKIREEIFYYPYEPFRG